MILWNGYAKLSHQRGKVGEARVVYVTALRAALSRLHEAQSEGRTEDAVWLEEDLETLWAGWAEMECIEGEDVRCQEVLVHAFGVRQEDIGAWARSAFAQYPNISRIRGPPGIRTQAAVTRPHSQGIEGSSLLNVRAVSKIS